MEFPGLVVEYGKHAVREGSLRSTLFGCPEGGHVPPVSPRCEVRAHRGESILLWWWGDAVHAVVRVEVQHDRIANLRDYHHAPEVITEVCRELGVPFCTHGYRPWP
jgi:RNA polymerase sigma-70 factor (ECF subfamily)